MILALEILVPEPEVVATSSLKVDGKNPNKMSREQHDRLKASIKKFGFIVPIITNKDYCDLCYERDYLQCGVHLNLTLDGILFVDVDSDASVLSVVIGDCDIPIEYLEVVGRVLFKEYSR